ncbi:MULTISPECIES: formate/nitrite transporter family protein [unclassified Lactococcus]|uniref:formate/nitrite transporter family protein n=1 Tax=unclassified Lactococcus TaxID=2643510 RepID=UPI0011C6EF87|nr:MULTISPECIES: formate/nitrite transporter family protein [unclassified Lactococcus]MQW23117.1 formate-nitrite transporter [Lactococcus sp. dk101]TXK44171.1 formate/nitrite transporter family protein [Lactococcus sp. dk310]TXK49902.1 formate/nitrite transporter family protein [Lactococcus sp. dk322]
MMNPAEILSATIHHGTEKVKRPMLEKAVLGFIGGAMISMGYLLYIRVVSSVVDELGSLASFIGAAVFPIGLIVILMGGGELITSNMTAVSVSFFAKKVKFNQLLKNWLFITLFNLLGAIFVAFFFAHFVGLTEVSVYKEELFAIADAKLNMGWLQTIVSGIGCNWFVGIAMWLSFGAKDTAGKLLAIWFPTMAFVAIGFQHSVANAFVLPAAIFAGHVSWLQFIQNFVLVYAGNIIGGVVFVAGFYYLGYRRQMNELEK